MTKKNTKSRSGIRDHSHKNKTLIAPINAEGLPLQFTTWSEERLGEVLWGALVLTRLPRLTALDALGRTAAMGFECKGGSDAQLDATDLSITALSENAKPLLEMIVRHLGSYSCEHVLRPLLLLDCLPNRDRWATAIQQSPQPEDWEVLAEAVGHCLYHQSNSASDLRWALVGFELAIGRLQLPEGPVGDDFITLWADYPALTGPALLSARATFRSAEGAIRRLPSARCKTRFTASMWQEVLEKTACSCTGTPLSSFDAGVSEPYLNLADVRAAVVANYEEQLRRTCAVNPRLDLLAGGALYAIRCLAEVCETPAIRFGIAGKALLRCLLELRINLAYLLKEDTELLWSKYRKYGAAQAKLALLKLDMVEGPLPSSLSSENLEGLASEDIYQEYVDIPLGSWSGEDLRKLSEKSGCKADYDKFYGWASSFVHAHWGAIRDSELTTCLNPLHRLHRIARHQPRWFEDPLPDAVGLTNEVLDLFSQAYPGLTARVTLQSVEPYEAETRYGADSD